MQGDDEAAPHRLFVLAVGNVPPELEYARLQSQDDFPVEDPAQAWNALSIGAYTDAVDIHEEGFDDWTALAGVGDLSPHSRTAANWPRGRSPIKPNWCLRVATGP